jgi:hypothetical protein
MALNATRREHGTASLGNSPSLPRLLTGRSRDSRTWQFCCDAETRDELTTQAENESSGNAVAAISLLLNSSSSILKTNTNKRNAALTNIAASTRDGKHEAHQGQRTKRTKFVRAQSSFARLQNGSVPKQSHIGSSELDGRDQHDKENWVPSEDGGHRRNVPHGPRPMPEGHERRRVLHDSTSGAAAPFKTGRAERGRPNDDGRAVTPSAPVPVEPNVVLDPEIERFMRTQVSPSRMGDLDCIQGLLSLSQGTWR